MTTSAFATCFLMLRDPRGGVEDLAAMSGAGFTAVYCNIGDHAAEDWNTIRDRANSEKMTCGPWLRTEQNGEFSVAKLDELLATAKSWGSPAIVNSEKEIDDSWNAWTRFIRDKVESEGVEVAFSTEPWPYARVDWTPLVNIPVLPQLFTDSDLTDVDDVLGAWWDAGITCVYPTFGSFGGRRPSDYNLQAPYSLYSADDCAQDYAAWSPTSRGYVGCRDNEQEDIMGTLIGYQDGIKATYNRLVKLDPGGSNPSRDPNNLDTWGPYDKLQRTLQILKDDHDTAIGEE